MHAVGRYYDEGEARAAKVEDLFAAVAPRYDLVNDLQSFGLHRLWKRRLVRLAEIRPGDRALDVCCGTGDVAFALAGAGAEVTGLDFSEPMLAVARRRAGERVPSKGPVPRFQQGDALQINLHVITAFGILFNIEIRADRFSFHCVALRVGGDRTPIRPGGIAQANRYL